MIGWLVVSALASPGAAGAVHLGAIPFEGGYVGGGGVALWTPDGAVGAPVIEGGAALSERVALTAMAGVGPGPSWPALVSGRWLAVNQDHLHLALLATFTALPLRYDPLELHLDPGIAIDAGGDKVRFDCAVPLWGVSSVGTAVGPERFPVPLLSTVGVDFAVGDRQRLRLGLPELLSWSYRGDHVYFDVGGVTVLVAGAVWAKVGAVF